MRFNKGMTIQKFETQKVIENRIMSIHQAITLTGRLYVCDITHAYKIAKTGILLGADIDTLKHGLRSAYKSSKRLRKSRNDKN